VNDAGALAGLVEKHARLGGAEEVFIAIAPDLDRDRRLIPMSRRTLLAQRFAIRASVAYKGAWVRRTQSFARDPAGANAQARAEAWLERVLGSLEAGRPLAAQLADGIPELPGAELKGFLAESSVGSYPLEVVASSRTPAGAGLAAGTFLVVTIELAIAGVPWLGAAPTYV
jgi:hypothetical protein